MYARTSTFRASTENVEQGVQQYRSALSTFREIPGNRGAFLFVDRENGRAVGVTLWESEQAMAESRERANELREQSARSAGAELESVNEYEVAAWDVSG